MHIFRIAQNEPLSPIWTETFPGSRVERPPFEEPADCTPDLCWVSTLLPDWAGVLRQQARCCRTVVISRIPTDDEAIQALDHGALGYCHALANGAVLRSVAATVVSGGLWVGQGVMSRMIRTLRRSLPRRSGPPPVGFESLTSREREVALAVTSGASNKEIAQQLGVSERTIKMHLGSIFRKLEVRDRLHLALFLSGPG